MKPSSPSSRREWLAIAVLTLVGAVLRSWSFGRLGLVHFDEGIYALAGLWAVMRGGLSALNPTLIAYAPPGFPILVGLAYALLGVADVSAILVSVICGTLTIPAAGWLGRRTFGPGAGAATAACAALSGMHVAFSRMALTDTAFLLAWLLAIGQGGRFLERPTLGRAAVLGLAVGIAQNLKYNGWLAGAIIALTALLGMAWHREERRRMAVVRVLGLGTCAAGAAALLYLPWFLFVQRHGGYAALLAHHRHYLGDVASWTAHLRAQVAQATALAGGYGWITCGYVLALISTSVACGTILPRAPRQGRGALVAFLSRASELLFLALLVAQPCLPWLLCLASSFAWLRAERPAPRSVGTWCVLMSILTPFYHPYARLWLPLLAVGWLWLGGVAAHLCGAGAPARIFPERAPPSKQPGFVPLAVFVVAALWIVMPRGAGIRLRPGLLAPSDSLRQACSELPSALPEGVRGLRLLARPPVTFYLGGRVPVRPQEDLGELLRPGDPSVWAVVDGAHLEQEVDPRWARARLLERWELVRAWRTELNLPTFLDLHPDAARATSLSPSTTLMLLRPRPSRASP